MTSIEAGGDAATCEYVLGPDDKVSADDDPTIGEYLGQMCKTKSSKLCLRGANSTFPRTHTIAVKYRNT